MILHRIHEHNVSISPTLDGDGNFAARPVEAIAATGALRKNHGGPGFNVQVTPAIFCAAGESTPRSNFQPIQRDNPEVR